MPYKPQDDIYSLDERQYAQLSRDFLDIGWHPKSHDKLLISDIDRYSSMYILGLPGSGKSGLIENMVHADIIAGRAGAHIDPHGDSIRKIIGRLPDHTLSRVHVIDMLDEAHPFGLNILGGDAAQSSIALAQKIEGIEHIIYSVWPETASQQYLPRYLRASIVILLSNPGTTLLDLYRLLIDDQFRHKLLKNVHDQSVLTFWQTQYEELSVTARNQRVGSLIGRFESLTMGRTLVRNIIGQAKSTIDFRQVILDNEFLLINLPVKILKGDAQLVGTMIVSQLHADIFSLVDIPPEKRPSVSFYVDELSNFCTPDFSEFITEARKYNCRLTVAHQYRAQLPKYLQASTIAARNIVSFRIKAEDAMEMAREYPASETSVRPEDINPHTVEHLLSYGSDNPIVQTFIEVYLRPLQAQKKGGTVEIKRPGTRWDHTIYWLTNTKAPDEKPKVADPTPYLNHLLYEVMRTGNADLPIPYEVAIGFSNCGRGFYHELRYSWRKEQFLSPELTYPPYLVVETANGMPRWTRLPETGREQLYHFLFHLRMVMLHLAQEPIGKKTTLSNADIASMLTQLPKRAAFIKSGDEVGTIYTNGAVPMVSPEILQQRIASIREQTRQKYCKPKAEVEKEPETEKPTDTTWEEVDE